MLNFSKFLDVQNILDAARLLKDNSEIKIYIIGTGDRSKEFFKKAGQLPNVTVTGWLNATDVRQILQNTSVGWWHTRKTQLCPYLINLLNIWPKGYHCFHHYREN